MGFSQLFKIVECRGCDESGEAPGNTVGQSSVAGFRMKKILFVQGVCAGFLTGEKCSADLHRRGAKNHRCGHALGIGDATRRDDRKFNRIDDLQDKGERAMQ